MGLADGLMKNDIPYKLISEEIVRDIIYQPNKPLRLLNKITLARRFLLVSLAK